MAVPARTKTTPTTTTTTILDLKHALAHRFPKAVASPPPLAEQPTDSEPSVSTARIPLGQITEVLGAVGAGGCSFVLEQMARVLEQPANWQGGGCRIWAAWVQLPCPSGELYPPAAAAMGVPLRGLLFMRVIELNVALRVVEALLRGGATRLIAVDMGPDARPLRLSTFHRLRRHVREHRAGLVFLARHSVVPADYRIELPEEVPATAVPRTAVPRTAVPRTAVPLTALPLLAVQGR